MKPLGSLLVAILLFFPQILIAQTGGQDQSSTNPAGNSEQAEIDDAVTSTAGIEFAEVAEAAVTCKIDPNHSTFIAKQTAGTKAAGIFSISVDDCRFSENSDGLSELNVELQLDLDENSDVTFCSAFSLSMLFEVKASTADFDWKGRRVIVDEVNLSTISGVQQSTDLFRIHQNAADKPTMMNDIIGDPDKGPSYDDLMWGDITVMIEPPSGEFASELRSKLPIIGAPGPKPDYSLELAVKIYPPRGVCIYRKKSNESAQHGARLSFTVKK